MRAFFSSRGMSLPWMSRIWLRTASESPVMDIFETYGYGSLLDQLYLPKVFKFTGNSVFRHLNSFFLFLHLIRGLRISRVLIRQTFCKYLVCTKIYQLICTEWDCTEYLFSQWDRIQSCLNQSVSFSFDQSEKIIYRVDQSNRGMATILHEFVQQLMLMSICWDFL